MYDLESGIYNNIFDTIHRDSIKLYLHVNFEKKIDNKSQIVSRVHHITTKITKYLFSSLLTVIANHLKRNLEKVKI